MASDALRGMDPEIAAARATSAKRDHGRMTILDACKLFIESRKRDLGETSSTIAQYVTLKGKLIVWGERHGIEYVQGITPLHLERWYSSSAWSHYAPSTKAQRWSCVRTMFLFWEKRGVLEQSPAASIHRSKVDGDHVQGPYTDAQVADMFANVESSMPRNLPIARRGNYAPRLRAFINLLLHTGADVSDAVLFEVSRIEATMVDKRKVYVYRYKRLKTGVQAVIPISVALAAELRDIPLESGTTAEMPFRTDGLKLRHDQEKWSKRVSAVLDAAGIEYVELPTRDKRGQVQTKDANVKMLRHTFAVRQLIAGQRPEELARMMGHVDTKMIYLHYAPFVKALDDAHIRRVVSVW